MGLPAHVSLRKLVVDYAETKERPLVHAPAASFFGKFDAEHELNQPANE
jgi:hypothetical protein